VAGEYTRSRCGRESGIRSITGEKDPVSGASKCGNTSAASSVVMVRSEFAPTAQREPASSAFSTGLKYRKGFLASSANVEVSPSSETATGGRSRSQSSSVRRTIRPRPAG
jgi:hypothetical protein